MRNSGIAKDSSLARPSKSRSSRAPNTLHKLARKLFSTESQQTRFVESVWDPRSYDPAVLWVRDRSEPLPFPAEHRFDWLPEFVDRISIEHRPGQHPLHDAGHYYCLGCSSVFAACLLMESTVNDPIIVDACASPGGKSIFAWRALAPQVLICNEVIGKRLAPLISNLTRCHIPARVTSCDTGVMATALPGVADVVIVDAPCSGQSLIAQGKESPGCFHPATINLNANRQRRILANASQVVAPGGLLAYITCTYAEKENERNLDWFRKRFPAFEPVEVPRLAAFQSHLSETPCYRLWPFDEQDNTRIGAGGFGALLQNRGEGGETDWNRVSRDLDEITKRRIE